MDSEIEYYPFLLSNGLNGILYAFPYSFLVAALLFSVERFGNKPLMQILIKSKRSKECLCICSSKWRASIDGSGQRTPVFLFVQW
jgi:hypothetical protein